jgi:hypothetical protein
VLDPGPCVPRDERWSSVVVARAASPLLSLPRGALRPGEAAGEGPVLEAVWGREVAVGCEAPGGTPPATVRLALEKATDRAELGAGPRAQVAYYPAKRETGAVFVCTREQLGPAGHLLYRCVNCSTVQCRAVQRSAVQCSAVQVSTVQCSAAQPPPVVRSGAPRWRCCCRQLSRPTPAHRSVQCSAVQCSAVQCSAVQCSAHCISAVQ